MKCEVIHDLLPNYLDDTCSEETRNIIEEHLNHCEDCHDLIKELKCTDDSKEQPVILEDRVFKKVIKNHQKSILGMLIVFVFIFLLFGTRLNSEIMKIALQSYAKSHYPEYELVMTDFGYRDPSSKGFGVNNAFYYGNFAVKDQESSDIHFSVITDGFFYKIKDTYHNHVEMKNNTCDRLIKEYETDVMKSLYMNSDLSIIEGWVSSVYSDKYYEENIVNKLELDMPYTRSIDQDIPMQLLLSLNVTESDVKDYKLLIKKIIRTLNENDFYPSELLLVLETKENQYRIEHINCQKDIDNQNLELNMNS